MSDWIFDVHYILKAIAFLMIWVSAFNPFSKLSHRWTLAILWTIIFLGIHITRHHSG